MSRLARLDAPGVLHHVIIRGIERRNIFENNKDRDNLLKRLEHLLPATKTSFYAWAMLSFPGEEKRSRSTAEPFFAFGRLENLDMGKENWL
jgi:hypothetical protein